MISTYLPVHVFPPSDSFGIPRGRTGSYEVQIFFNNVQEKNMVSCMAMVGHNEQIPEATQVSIGMQEELTPAMVIPPLRACTECRALEEGRQLHATIIEAGLESDLSVCNTLIDFYGKCNACEDARVVHNRVPGHDRVSWNAIITGFTQNGLFEEAFGAFKAMQEEGFTPDQTTFVCLLTACCKMGSMVTGMLLHTIIVNCHLDPDVRIGNNLINMYSRSGSIEDAKAVFSRLPEKDVITWNCMIRAYLEREHHAKAFRAFGEMHAGGITPDKVTFLSVLRACSSALALEEGKWIHSLITQQGLDLETSIGNTLVDMYGKCGSLHDARMVFNKLPKSSIVTWNAMMAGYASHDDAQEVLQLHLQMQQGGIKPDKVTFLSLIKACAVMAALGLGKRIHYAIREAGFALDLSISNALLDMYAKCGNLENARMVFDGMPKRDVVTWTSLISGYAEQNDYSVASQLFYDMLQDGVKPDDITFLSLLAACSHKGLVDRAIFHLKEMRERHGIRETMEHYCCMVDLFGCREMLDVGEDLLETICFPSNLVGWLSLLGSCRLCAKVDIARRCFGYIGTITKCGHAAAHVLMASTYARVGMHKEAEELESLRKVGDAWKKPGKAYIEIGVNVHYFTAEDRTHPGTEDVHAKLESLSQEAKSRGLFADCFVPHTIQDSFCKHSEKLAIAFGLLNTPSDSPIRVAKNIRVCSSCHQAIKAISKMERREIIVRDVDCLHCFRDGTCSCQDRYYI